MTETKKYGYIDALRGYAVLMVMIDHTAQLVSTEGVWLSFISKMAMGVQLFYVVSALTLTMSWNSRQDGALRFFIRRIFRIGPLFWIAIAFYLALYGFGQRAPVPLEISWADVLLTATFTHMISPGSINSVVPGGWSVAVEMAFYAIFPLCMLVVRGWKSALAFLLVTYYVGKSASLVLANYYSGGAYSFELLEAWKFYILPSQISAFGVGMLLFYVIRAASKLNSSIVAYVSLIAAALSALSAFYLLQYGGPIAVLTYSSIFALFALSLSTGRLSFFTGVRVQKIGVLSFSAYLSHFAVIYLLNVSGVVRFALTFGDLAGFVVLSLLVISITLAVSKASHHFIEVPGIQLGNALIRRFQRTAAA